MKLEDLNGTIEMKAVLPPSIEALEDREQVIDKITVQAAQLGFTIEVYGDKAYVKGADKHDGVLDIDTLNLPTIPRVRIGEMTFKDNYAFEFRYRNEMNFTKIERGRLLPGMFRLVDGGFKTPSMEYYLVDHDYIVPKCASYRLGWNEGYDECHAIYNQSERMLRDLMDKRHKDALKKYEFFQNKIAELEKHNKNLNDTFDGLQDIRSNLHNKVEQLKEEVRILKLDLREKK